MAKETEEAKKLNEEINTKAAKDEIEKQESKRDKFFNKLSGKINKVISKEDKEEKKTPKEEETQEEAKKLSIGKIPLNWKKLLPFSPLLLIIAFAIYVKLFQKTLPTREGQTIPPTPTYSPFQKFKPSVYANDPTVIKLEETLNVLDREMATVPLTEDTLTPPVLDFNISF